MTPLLSQCNRKTHLLCMVWVEGAYISVVSSKSRPHQMGDFSHGTGSRCRIFIGHRLCMSFCRVKIGRWQTQILASRNLVRSAAVHRTNGNCRCDEQRVGKVYTFKQIDLGCLERMGISEVTCGPPSGEGSCTWSLRWLMQFQGAWWPVALLLCFRHRSAN